MALRFMRGRSSHSFGKIACGAFADNAFVSDGKRRDFCRLHGRVQKCEQA
jgi:hypothetical protein